MPGGHVQIWPRETTAAVVLKAGSTGVDHSDSRIVYQAEQVVRGPVN